MMQFRTVFSLLAVASCLALISVPASAQLWDNGPLVTDPGGGFSGFDASRLQTGENTLGYGHQVASNNRVADDFTVGGPGWIMDSVTLFAYRTAAPQPVDFRL